jgi:1D-myo-inositol 3-kinase
MSEAPDLLLVGHVTRDLLPGGDWRLGGTVTYAAATAARLGLRPAVVTSGPDDVIAAWGRALPDVPLATTPALGATTFENIYTPHGARRQYLRGRATPLGLDQVPPAWRAARCVLLAPLAREVDVALARAFPRALVAATAQGWLRRWSDDGRVFPGTLERADELLPHLGVLILSREDLLPPADIAAAPGAPTNPAEADAVIASWARIVPLVVVTEGATGARLTVKGGTPRLFPGYPAREVDPTGAGDVFATALLAALAEGATPADATDFANQVAALSVEHAGLDGIPTRADVAARYSGGPR